MKDSQCNKPANHAHHVAQHSMHSMMGARCTKQLPLASQLRAHLHAPYSRGGLCGERRGAVCCGAGRVVGHPSLAGDAAARGTVRSAGLERECLLLRPRATSKPMHQPPSITDPSSQIHCCPLHPPAPAYVYGVPASRLGRLQVSPVTQPPPSRLRRRVGSMVQVGAVTQLPP